MSEKKTFHVLRIDSSARRGDSVSRRLGDAVMGRLAELHPDMQSSTVDLGAGMPHIDGDWVAANLIPAEQRSPTQRSCLQLSDEAVQALARADAVVLTAPVYNFSVPSVLKAWIDHVCRAGMTFRYTADGPQGLLADRPVYLAMASGGVPFGSDVDFASTYLRQVFRFIGIEDVRLIAAEGVAMDPDAAWDSALQTIDDCLSDDAAAVA